MIPEDINLKIQAIDNDLALLRDKHIYEIEKVPGTLKCSTLANRIQAMIILTGRICSKDLFSITELNQHN